MSETDEGTGRRYSAEEIEKIFDRASELEQHGAPGAGGSKGMSLVELQQIGVEAGMDPALLRQAAHELDMGIEREPSGAARRWLGAPLELELERIISGEVDEGVFERLVPLIQMAAEGVGHAAVIGRTLTWQSADPTRQRQLSISVTSRDGHTSVRIEERYNTLAGGTFGGLVGGLGGGVGFGVGVGVGVGALGSALFATVFPLAALTGSYFLARTVYRTTVAGRRKVLTQLLDRVTAEVEAIARRAVAGGDDVRLGSPDADPPRLPGSSGE